MHFLPKCIGRREQSDDAQGQHDDGIPENTHHKHTSFKSPANATLNMSNRSIDGLWNFTHIGTVYIEHWDTPFLKHWDRVKLRRFFIGGTQDDGVRTAQTFPRLSRPLTPLSGL